MGDLKVGMVCIYWPPAHGGAERYAYEMAQALRNRGVDLEVFTGTTELPDKNNGDVEVIRPEQNYYMGYYGDFVESTSAGKDPYEAHPSLFRVYEWFNDMLKWAKEGDFTHFIVNAPLGRVCFIQGREVFSALKQTGAKVGCIHHDLGINLIQDIEATRKEYDSWAETQQSVQDNLKRILSETDDIYRQYYLIDSPLFFDVDFIINNSAWGQSFLDVFDTIPKYVLHPPIDFEYWDNHSDTDDELESTNIGFINPQYHKGRSHMANIINDRNHKYTFRVLKGGWGDSYREFVPMVEKSLANTEGRLHLDTYVENIRGYYKSLDLFMFPSRYEGYGYAGIEPMLCGTPVISSDYPAIVEAVGDGALLIESSMLRHTPHEDVMEAIEDLYLEYDEWIEAGNNRVKELKIRQEQEFDGLIPFLEGMSE